jgi:hypothetical protein
MATQDIPRSAYDRKKRYDALGMQQGRVPLADDFNEAEEIASEDERLTRVDVIGPVGSPDEGFRITNARTNTHGELELDIRPGTLYVGGLRVENLTEQRYTQQLDWLQQPANARVTPQSNRTDLAWIAVWQQPVCAVEDGELLEAALGGADTSTRLRTMWRVFLSPGVSGDDCAEAWQTLVSGWKGAGGPGTLGAGNLLVPDATLGVTFDPGGDSEDLCSPQVAGGYLGAENQAIRVQVVDGSHFTWGFDNASATYRVRIGEDRTTVNFDTEPKDQAHWPRGNQVVEVLSWSAVLSNGEKLAEQVGHLSLVAAAYDPDTRQLELATPLPMMPSPLSGEAWKSRDDAASLGEPYYFLRVWDRGDDLTSPPALPFTPGTPADLGHTGLNVTFKGSQFVAGDHWIIAARPETPNRVVPWELEAQRGPHGVRRFVAPLALVRWTVSGGKVTGQVLDDCRPHFEPLTRLKGCCTFTVGDGVHSHGQFTRIQDAIDALPPAGGKVCVLAGVYEERVVVSGRQVVTLEGCGRLTKLRAPAGETGGALITILASTGITVRSLTIEAPEARGVVVAGDPKLLEQIGGGVVGPDTGEVPAPSLLATGANAQQQEARWIRLEELYITVRDWSAVLVLGARDVVLLESQLLVEALAKPLSSLEEGVGRWPAVYMAADDVLIEGNIVHTANTEGFTQTALGGIQLAGGSERVALRRNEIIGGNGHGVTLGSVAYVAQQDRGLANSDWLAYMGAWTYVPSGWGFVINEQGCIEVTWEPTPPGGDEGSPLVPVSMGALQDILISDNDIREMGSGAIAVARFFDLAGVDELITVDRLTIEDNRIRRCLRHDVSEIPPHLRDFVAFAAIALADGELIVLRDNTVEECGKSHVDPVCGVFVLQAEGLLVERNRITDNAPRSESDTVPRPGLRGGLVVMLARAPVFTANLGGGVGPVPRQNGVPAARIHDNIIVQPEGRALLLLALGPVSVEGNQFTSRGLGLPRGAEEVPEGSGPLAFLDSLGGSAVAILNLGLSNELFYQIALLLFLKHSGNATPSPGMDLLVMGRNAAGGNVLFEGNQVVLDLLDSRLSQVVSSVLLYSMDDIGVVGNQFDCDLWGDVAYTDLMVLSFSARVSDNRMKEPRSYAFLSGLVYALMATVTNNQSTHCLFVAAANGWKVDSGNRVLTSPGETSERCLPARSAGAAVGSKYLDPIS